MRERIGKIGTEAARAVGYRSAGTIEGLLQDGEYFFLEMNTRVQVEHCVTEMVTGIDIVREQIRIAAGEDLSVGQEDVRLNGHAIECRVNAEDAAKNFAPAPGDITAYFEPSGPGVRVDSGVEAGSAITPLYDPMIAKLIVWDTDREKATSRMVRALREFKLGGVKSLIPFHIGLLQTEQWARGETCRDLIGDKSWLKQFAFEKPPAAEQAEEEAAQEERTYAVEVSGRRFDVKVIGAAVGGGGAGGNGSAPAAKAPRRRERSKAAGAPGEIVSPLQGTVLKVAVEKGAEVAEGALVCVIEAMKMENEITAPAAGTVEELNVSEGGAINSGDTIAVIK
jgi:acetyl-CoA/propionyl-CoA carboxylase biotin carboxyl carrier protein